MRKSDDSAKREGSTKKRRVRPFWVRLDDATSDVLVVPLEPPGGYSVGPRSLEIIGPPSRAYGWIGDEVRLYGTVPLRVLKAAIERFEREYHAKK